MKAIDIIFDNLKSGKVYATYYKDVRFPCYYYNIIFDRAKNLFFYNHYGSSAVKATKERLSWLINVIFDCSPEEFIARYDCVTREQYNEF